MAGRGCTITIKVLDTGRSSNNKNDSTTITTDNNDDDDDLSLPVALHSPLEVLKHQLTEIIGIPIQDQVLILCNLNDPDRNSDILLTGRDFMTLNACGIKNGSVLTLHALGLSSELKQKLMKEALLKKNHNINNNNNFNNKPIYSLTTDITAAEANHSYNGIIFDIQCIGPYEINILSISIGGMLGRIRIYARDRPWSANTITPTTNQWWAHQESPSREGWELVVDKFYRPSWDRHIEIKLNKPIKLLPHTRRGFYCHSSLPDDLGIQYQSYQNKDNKVAESQYVIIYPGLGHTGSIPFDDTHGWYRSYRGLAGSISYTAEWKGWSPFEHHIFPNELKQSVLTLLLCQNTYKNNCYRNKNNDDDDNNNKSVFNRLIMNMNSKKKKNIFSDHNFPSKKIISNNYDKSDNNYNTKAKFEDDVDDDNKDNSMIKSSLNITNLPVFVIYYIMEFMVSK